RSAFLISRSANQKKQTNNWDWSPCPLLAQSRREPVHHTCPLSEVKRISLRRHYPADALPRCALPERLLMERLILIIGCSAGGNYGGSNEAHYPCNSNHGVDGSAACCPCAGLFR